MKPLLIIALIAIFGNVVVGVMNRKKFVDARKQKDEFNRTVYENFKKVDDVNSETSDLIDKFSAQDKSFEADKYEKEKEEKSLIARRPTENQEAYDLYLRGRALNESLNGNAELTK